MNGSFKDLLVATHTYRSKHKKRTFEDQKFDNVFYGVPFDEAGDSTVPSLNYTAGYDSFNQSGDILSESILEKSARLLYGIKGLVWTKPSTEQEKVQKFLNETFGEQKFLNETFGGSGSETEPSNLTASILKRRLQKKNRLNHISESALKENQFLGAPKAKRRKNSRIKPKRTKPLIYKENRRPLRKLPVNNNNRDSSSSSSLELLGASSSIPSTSQLFQPKANKLYQDPPKTSKTPSDIPDDLTLFHGFSEKQITRDSMMTDYPENQVYHHVANGDSLPDCNVATLLNMGNTCFLNSVLYTLRFAPTFLHNLHHLLVDLSLVNSKLKENKTKTSSLGRNGSAVSGSSWRSASSKDLLSIGNNDIIPKSKDQIVTEKLHALFVTMNNLETKDSPDPYQPEALLQAMRDANPLFEGNHQQDAHEFFVELLSCLRVTCDKLNEQIEQNPDLIKSPEPTSASMNNNSKIWGVRRSWKKPLKKKEKSTSKKNGELENGTSSQFYVTMGDSEDNLSSDGCGDTIKKKFGYNFIAEDFQGVSLHRTKCLECEEVSELKEPFLEIQVPVNYRDEDFDPYVVESSIFGAMCVTSEKLCDQNKYFCENCNRYNEAQRTVLYEKLPNIMVLHLKRFTTSLSGVQKVNTYVPTPLEIRCFCESCSKVDRTKMAPHKYRLSCVIMHLGASMASGHYIAYSRAAVETYDYIECTRDIPKNYLSSSSKELSANFLKFFRPKALGNSLSETQNGIGPNAKKNDTQVCQSLNCCGIRCKLNLGSPTHNDDWLEFDDEKVKILSNKEFIDMLNRRHETTNTPYLLFYSKV